jgi:hypothetical protein
MNDLVQGDEISDIWNAIDNLSPVKRRDVYMVLVLGTNFGLTALMSTEVPFSFDVWLSCTHVLLSFVAVILTGIQLLSF